jgi:hypothetical protein
MNEIHIKLNGLFKSYYCCCKRHRAISRLDAAIKAYDSQRARRFEVKNVIYPVTALLPVFV